MGLFDFMSSAGDKPDTGNTTGGDMSQPDAASEERVAKLREENITRMIGELDVDDEQVQVAVVGDTAVLTGTAPSQEAMEKIVLCAGNQYGVAQVDCQMQVDQPEAAAAPEEESTFYTVQAGDTLGKIAAQHYGAASKYTMIFEANRPMLENPDKIYPGQTLRLPVA
jgi:nucleoid-associated protein YgaU